MADGNGEVTLRTEDLFRTVGQIRACAKPLEPLWGYFLFRKAITLMVGDPGISKTTMCYTLASELCNGKPFLGIHPEEPVKCVYMDLESSDSLVVSRTNLILPEDIEDIPNFWIYNTTDYFLSSISDMLAFFCEQEGINLLIIDNQSMAFNTHDENDNAEAIKQMGILRKVTNACNVATLIIHHPSKANLPGTRKGSGAYARSRLADICINVDLTTDDNIVQFEVSKNRMVGERCLWYLRKDEGSFAITDPPLGTQGQPTDTKVFGAQKAVLELFSNGHDKFKRKEILDQLRSTHNETDVDNALKRLVQQSRLTNRRHYGYYSRM